MTDCFKCKHFHQTASLDFSMNGYCEWTLDKVPYWLEWYISTNDQYYGPKKEVYRNYDNTGYVEFRNSTCKAFEAAPDEVYIKRSRLTWYE